MLEMITNIENQSFTDTSGTTHNSTNSASSSDKSFNTANQSLYSETDEYLGEILVIEMEHEILIGECTENSKYYLKLKNVINPITNDSSPEQQLYKKYMISINQINTTNKKKVFKEKVNPLDMKISINKINRTRPEIFVTKANKKFKESIGSLQRSWLLICNLKNDCFQVLTESTIYTFDMELLKYFKKSLESFKGIKVQHNCQVKLPNFLDLAILPNSISLEKFIEKHIDLPEELIYENEIAILEVYFMFLMKNLYSTVFQKCQKYSSIYSKNDDWGETWTQMRRRVLPEL